MKHLMLFNLFESVKTIEEIYDKHYSYFPHDTFKEIINTDPTTKSNKMGIYSKWLLNLFTSKSTKTEKSNLAKDIANTLGYRYVDLRKLEDLYKATDYLKLYHRFKHKLPIEQRNIDNIKSLPELAKLIEPFKDPEPELLSKSENKSAAFVKSFENFDLYSPKTYEQSRDLGRGTEWCTAADSENGKKMFKKYKTEGRLYILISKTNPKEKYQFHFESAQLVNILDNRINISEFMDTYPDIKKYFKTKLNNIFKYLNFKSFETKKVQGHPSSVYYVLDGDIMLEAEFYFGELTIWVNYTIWNNIENLYNVDYHGAADYIRKKLLEISINSNYNLQVAVTNRKAHWVYMKRMISQMS